MELINIIKLLNSSDFYGAGKYTEIAKGKYKYTTTWKGFKYKINRIWQSRKQ
jgi:hypothetical protein